MVIATGIFAPTVNYYCHVGDNFTVRESEGRKFIDRDYTQRALVPRAANAEKIRAFTAAQSGGADVVEVEVWEPLRQLARERQSPSKRARQIAAAEARKREQG